MNVEDLKHYLADSPPSVVRLEIEKHFNPLADKQKRYSHYISKAAFAGTRIVLRQISPESEAIYDFILSLHEASAGDWPSLAKKAGVSEKDLTDFLDYAAMFLGNNGNYKSFGDSKFIPRCDESVFKALAATSPKADQFYSATNGAVFSADKPGLLHLGYVEDGHMTTYYPETAAIANAEIDAISAWMEKKGLLPENTRLRKTGDGNFELLIASAISQVPSEGGDIGQETEFVIDDGALKGKTIKLTYGDYSKEMKAIAEYIKKAAENGDNPTQTDMHTAYAKSFESGSLLDFKNSQRFWIRDKGPMVECNIGFIETYRDPAGIRVERTRAFSELVSSAPGLIPLLPWGTDFEKDAFLSPDFTSLEVLTFAGSGIPAGINIPNYDDIRQTEGFKNVSLGNVLSAKAPNEKIPFIADSDLEVYKKYRDASFEVQVGLHELTAPCQPECRAELVAMYLSCEFPVLKIFGFGDGSTDLDGEAGDVLYASYLSMARAGLVSLEMWDPKSRKWGQAHSQARFSILQCFLQAGDDFCKLEYKNDDLSDLTIKLDRSKILTAGRDAVGKYLQKLHIYKSTADVDNGNKFYTDMTTVDVDFWGNKVRNVVLQNKQPRKVFVQANTTIDEATGKVSIKHYEASPAGMIESWAERAL
ncbi:unnamed protein product [Parascedosporium putredinis]|uniref:Dipeptidyl peptidase 3 n=1 Tax=Parascedosporium putredinis TaxID=1442378 RepID=A0A9P1H461_9PEZI|nr:unnamed protein product [Parascedosporium putredinis]CAI7997931.1 unnamed protein product [Parascedosporium putredinis]